MRRRLMLANHRKEDGGGGQWAYEMNITTVVDRWGGLTYDENGDFSNLVAMLVDMAQSLGTPTDSGWECYDIPAEFNVSVDGIRCEGLSVSEYYGEYEVTLGDLGGIVSVIITSQYLYAQNWS